MNNLSKIGIYRLISSSGKSYVGLTTVSFAARLNRHLQMLRNGNHHCKGLQCAADKYGVDSFNFEILEAYDRPTELRKLEHLTGVLLLRENYYWNLYNKKAGTYNGNPLKVSPTVNRSTMELKTKEEIKRFTLKRVYRHSLLLKGWIIHIAGSLFL